MSAVISFDDYAAPKSSIITIFTKTTLINSTFYEFINLNMYLGLKIFTNLSIIKVYRLKKSLKCLKQLKMQTRAQSAQIIN
jgi:hypothetical protein